MSTVHTNEHTFRSECDLIDVTSNHRPDTGWRFVDSNGHEHRWHADGRPAESYHPTQRYEVPTLVWIKDGVGYYEDGEPYDIGHSECRECGAHVTPGYCPDMYQHMIPGLRRFYIDDRPVTKEEFERAAREAGLIPPAR